MPLSTQGNISANAINSINVWHTLLTFSLAGHEPLRVCNNTEDVISRGNKFIPCGFDIVLPQDDGESLPTVKIAIPNVDRMIIEWIRGFPTAPTLMLEIVLSSQPDIVERSIDYMRLSDVTYDSMQITGTLHIENVLSAGFPSESYTPIIFPAIQV
jgi:hypothetical protein